MKRYRNVFFAKAAQTMVKDSARKDSGIIYVLMVRLGVKKLSL